MASNNTTMDVLRPEFWAGAFDELDIANYNLQNLVSRDQEGLIAKMGDTINIPIQTDLGEAADWTEGGSISGTAIAQTVKQVVLSESKQAAIQLSAKELTMSAYDLISTYGVPMAQSILQAVNNSIYKVALGSTLFNYVGAVSGLDEDDIIDAGASLSENNVALDGRIIVASPTDMAKLKKCDAFQHVDVTGDTGVMADGRLTRKLGFDFYENPIVAKYTPAAVSGLVNNKGAAYAAGDTTVVVDGFNDDAAPIRVGDIVTFAGEESGTKHTITATTTSSSDTVSITFSPALDGTSPADDDSAVTITPTRSLLAMRKNAIAAAFRAYSPLPGGTGVQSSVINANGIPVRISLYHDGKLGLMVVADVLYGCTLVNGNRLCRIVTL